VGSEPALGIVKDFAFLIPSTIPVRALKVFEENVDALRLNWSIVEQAIERYNHD